MQEQHPGKMNKENVHNEIAHKSQKSSGFMGDTEGFITAAQGYSLAIGN